LLQCFTRVPYIVVSLETGSSPVVRTTLCCPFSRCISFGSFSTEYLKDRVYANNPQAIDALKNNIGTEMRSISHDMLYRVITNSNARVATVIQRQRVWIEHIIKY